MSSRENILKAALENQPGLVPLPQINLDAVIGYENLAAQFDLILTRIGGKVEHFQDEAALLGASAGTPALRIDRVALSLDGSPVELRVSLCLTEEAHYLSDLR